MEADLVQRVNIPFAAIPAAGVHGVSLKALPGNLAQLLRGVQAAGRILREFKPDVLFFTGGYVAAPMAWAGRRIPSLVYVPDIEPGFALKFLGRFASRIALTTEDSRGYFPGRKNLVVTGYPTRPELGRWNRAEGRAALGLHDRLPVLLVFGGSKGARSINRALMAALPTLLDHAQVVHISGQLDWEEVQISRRALPDSQADNYHAFPYLHEEMGAALAAADLVLSRAGASTLGEFPFFALPAVLVPYPYAWRYQKVNAEYLASRGAAVMLEDGQLGEKLPSTLQGLLQDSLRLEAMRAAARSLARPQAAQEIAQQLIELAGSSTGGHA